MQRYLSIVFYEKETKDDGQVPLRIIVSNSDNCAPDSQSHLSEFPSYFAFHEQYEVSIRLFLTQVFSEVALILLNYISCIFHNW